MLSLYIIYCPCMSILFCPVGWGWSPKRWLRARLIARTVSVDWLSMIILRTISLISWGLYLLKAFLSILGRGKTLQIALHLTVNELAWSYACYFLLEKLVRVSSLATVPLLFGHFNQRNFFALGETWLYVYFNLALNLTKRSLLMHVLDDFVRELLVLQALDLQVWWLYLLYSCRWLSSARCELWVSLTGWSTWWVLLLVLRIVSFAYSQLLFFGLLWVYDGIRVTQPFDLIRCLEV